MIFILGEFCVMIKKMTLAFDSAELVARVNANLRQYQRMVEKFANKGPDASEEILETVWGAGYRLNK